MTSRTSHDSLEPAAAIPTTPTPTTVATPTSLPSLWRTLGSWYGLVLLASAVLLGVQQLGIDPDLIEVVQLGPVVAVGLLWWVSRRRMRALLPARVDGRGFARAALVCAAVITAWVAVVLGYGALTGSLRDGLPLPAGLLAAYLPLQLVGAIGEEVGWRGFLQPALETRMGRTIAALVTGVLWAVWHVPVFADPVAGLGFTAFCVVLSVAYAHCVRGDLCQRGLLAGAMHMVVNVTLFLGMTPGSIPGT